MLASSQLDLVVGLDIHMEMVPMPAPVPTPFPMPFVGQIEFDAVGVLLGAGVAAAMSAAFGDPPKGPVLVNGFQSTKTGDEAKNAKTMPHIVIPPGTMWTPLPKPLKLKMKPGPPPVPDSPAAPPGDAVMITGSKTVYFEQSNACRLGTLAMSCSDPVRLPSSTLLAIPKGLPVLVGGPDTFDWATVAKAFLLRNKWTAGLLHQLISLLPSARLRGLLHWAACELTGHPVDVATGRLLTRAQEFTIPGPLRLTFERYYSSAWAHRDSALGFGWGHSFEERIWEERGRIVLRTGDGRELEFHTHELPDKRLGVGEQLYHAVEALVLISIGPDEWQTVEPDGTRRHYVRDTSATVSTLRRIANRRNDWLLLEYNSDGSPARVSTSEGFVIHLHHELGHLVRIDLPSPTVDGEWHAQRTYTYDATGDLRTARDALGHCTKYAYENHLLVSETNRDELAFYFEYDGRSSDSSCIRTWGNDHRSTDRLYHRELTYNRHDRTTIVEDSLGHSTAYVYNIANVVISVTTPDGSESKRTVDDRLRIVAQTGPLGATVHRTYDASGNETERTLENGETFRATYDATGNLIQLNDPRGAVTTWRYDEQGRQIEQRGSDSYDVGYTSAGRTFRRSSDSGIATTTEELNRFGDVVRILVNGLARSQVQYDLRGRRTRSWDGAGRRVEVSYDLEDRVVEVTGPDPDRLRRLAYSGEGHIIRDETNGLRTEFEYVGHGRLAAVREAGTSVVYIYDSEDELTGITNEANELYSLKRDVCGRVAEEVTFEGRRYQFERDARGALVGVTWPDRRTSKLERDVSSNVIKEVYSDGTSATFRHNALGEVTSGTNDVGTVHLDRDSHGRVVKERLDESWVVSEFDRSGYRRRVVASTGVAQNFGRDGLGLIGAIHVEEASTTNSSTLWSTTIDRDGSGQRRRELSAGTVDTSWTYDTSGRENRNETVTARSQAVWKQYLWNADDRVIRRDSEANTTNFDHDSRLRLTGSISKDGSRRLRLMSSAGNIFESEALSDRTYGKGGVLLEKGDTIYSYDANGNLAQKRLADGSVWSYAWNGRGLLRSVERPDGELTSFTYDAFGRRVTKHSSATKIRWQWDGDNVICEHDSSKNVRTVWVSHPEELTVVARIDDTEAFTVRSDFLGVPVHMFNRTGDLVWKSELDIFGTPKIYVGKLANCPFRWPGQYADEETGLYYNRFRYYDPDTGLYISQDPVGLLGLETGSNLYSYTSDPLVFPDPFGLAVPLQIGTFGSLTGGSNVGDKLDAHEMFRHSFLRDMGVTGDNRHTGNPSIAIDRALHNTVHENERALRAAAGLGADEFAGTTRKELNLMEKAMIQAGIPKRKVTALKTDAAAFAKANNCG